MNDPLLSYLHKLHRADQHLQSLNAEIYDFLQPDCCEIVGEFDHEEGQLPVRGIFRRRVIFKKAPPLLRWATLIGDFVNNLRSSLDHLIYAISYSRNPDGFRDDRTTEFPIMDNPDAFNRPRRRDRPPRYEIRGVGPDAEAIIEGLQPYHRRKDHLSDDPLWILREMSNIDKHRSIHLTTWSAHEIALDITSVTPGTRIHRHTIRPPGVIESGAVLVEIDMTISRYDEPAMEMEKSFFFTVAFDESTVLAGKQAQVALYNLAVYVEGITNSLSGFIAR